MVKKIVIMLLVVSLLTITVYADVLAPAMNSPTRLALIGTVSNLRYIRTFGNDLPNHNYVDKSLPCPAWAVWMSSVYADTIYKLTLQLEPGMTTIGETGFMNHTDDFAVYLIPAEYMLTGLDLSPSMYTVNQTFRETWSIYDAYRLPDEQYEIFWDASLKQLSCLFYNQDVSTNSYIMMRLGTWSENQGLSSILPIKSEIIKGAQGIYSEILQDIKQILQESSGDGGGLTDEQLNEVIQEALNAHDQALENDVGTLLDNILDQIDGIVSPYSTAADQINTAFDGLSDVFSSTSTASVFKFPAGRMPNGVVLWQEHNIDIGAAWLRIPAKFRAVVQIVCTFTILYAVIKEAIFIIRFIILGRKGSEDD